VSGGIAGRGSRNICVQTSGGEGNIVLSQRWRWELGGVVIVVVYSWGERQRVVGCVGGGKCGGYSMISASYSTRVRRP